MLGTKSLVLLGLVSSILISVRAEPTPEDRLLAAVYSNFSAGVLDALAKDDLAEAKPAPATGAPGFASPPVTISSLFGLTHILAVIHEKSWPVAVPVFESLLTKTPKNLPESYALLAGTVEKDTDIKLSSLIFTSEKLELTPALGKLKVELVNTDLKSKDAVSTINSQLAKKVETPLEETYIPKDSTLSPAAIALLTDTLHLSESWPVPLKKVSGLKFNGKEDVDFVEISGKFNVLENDKVIEVFIPFKNEKRGISIVLLKDPKASATSDMGELKPMEMTSARIQLPTFKVTMRQSQATLASSSKCDFKKEDNFLQLFDELAYASLEESKFEAISISAGQINNVAEFKKELAKGNKGKAIDGPAAENKVASDDKPAAAAPPVAGPEKLIIFNRPFTWSILDTNLGPLFAGTVDSLAFVKNPPALPKPAGPSVFGSEKSLPFEKCL